MEKKDFKIVFMGTPDFAVESLKALIEANFNIVGVVTSPDKPAGRGQKINQSAVKIYAELHNLLVMQPSNLKDPEFEKQLKSCNAKLHIIVAFRMLPESIWSMPPLGSINLHGSLLPHYRGAAPINWAVINGEQKTGVTTFFLKHEIDTGDILFQEEISIEPNDNAGFIHDKLMKIGANLIVKTTQSIVENNYKEIPQKTLIKEDLKHAPKIFKADCQVNWQNSMHSIHNHIRGLSPYPAAWSTLTNETDKDITFKIFKTTTEIKEHNYAIGSLISDEKTYLKIAISDGFLIIVELQLSGKKKMLIQDFLRGFKQIENYKAI